MFIKEFGTFILFLSLFARAGDAYTQESKKDVYVDKFGVMRWGHGNKEVKGFGVNYSVPFAHAYRSAKKLGINVKEAIDKDVYHFSRLDFDLYRIHVWDTEISDAEGNLLENEHLETFDYLIKQLKDRGINFMITPIAYWGNGWPEPDEENPGFSYKYGKDSSLTNPEAIKAQEKYLAHFLEHVNPYTGVAYKNEPNIIAFEISNEPHHKGTPEEVTAFIQRMVTSMRSTGTKKPIFYNVSHSTHLAEAYFNADIQGGTFQWYPTGLGFEKELEGNLLPNVNEYTIPFNDVIKENKAAKLVYEFDAADVMKSYIYPAMARSFREAGIQIATHFAYDPTYMAFGNTEYNTHYMNLAYTPQKALALMISGKVFHEIPMNRDFGTYPQNLKFEDFIINYEKDLATYNSDEEFIYTNSHDLEPKNLKKLKKIAGFGDSRLVKYEGTGAYFLDRMENGIWRLEVMPDAILVDNPFGKNSLNKMVGVVNWSEWDMTLDLPELGFNFSVQSLNNENTERFSAEKKSFKIQPGSYILIPKDNKITFKGSRQINNISINEFYAPESTVEKTYVIHEPVKEVVENSHLEISATIVSHEEIEKVEIWFQNGNVYESVELQRQKAYKYSAVVPQQLLLQGYLNYQIIVITKLSSYTFPGDVQGNPRDWDFYTNELYTTTIVKTSTPLYLFRSFEDSYRIVGKWQKGNQLVPGPTPGEAEYQVKVERLFEIDEENRNAKPVYDYSLRFNFSNNIKGRRGQLSDFGKIIVKGRSLSSLPIKVQIALVNRDGVSFGKIIEMQPHIQEYIIEIPELKPVKTVSLPRPYPTFLPYYFEHNNVSSLQVEEMEAIQVSIGPGMDETELKEKQEVGIISIRLE